jgi:hypothetical protein
MKIKNRIKVKSSHYAKFSVLTPHERWREYKKYMYENYGLQFTSYRMHRFYFKHTDKQKLSLFLISNAEYITK